MKKEINYELFEIENNKLIKYLGDKIESGTISKKIIIPDGIKVIGENAFKLANIEEVIIPEGVEEIESGAFYLTFNLKIVDFPKSLKKIGSGAFAESSIKTVKITNDNLELDGSFLDCYALEKIELGKNVTIKENTFSYCTELKKIIISKSYNLETNLPSNISIIEKEI